VPLGPKKLGLFRSFLVRPDGRLRGIEPVPFPSRRYSRCIAWGGFWACWRPVPVGDGKTPTGGRRCPPEARATLQCFVKFFQSIKWELPSRFTPVYRRRCAGKLVDSNARWLGCFFPRGQPGPKPRFFDVAFTTPDGWSHLSL